MVHVQNEIYWHSSQQSWLIRNLQEDEGVMIVQKMTHFHCESTECWRRGRKPSLPPFLPFCDLTHSESDSMVESPAPPNGLEWSKEEPNLKGLRWLKFNIVGDFTDEWRGECLGVGYLERNPVELIMGVLVTDSVSKELRSRSSCHPGGGLSNQAWYYHHQCQVWRELSLHASHVHEPCHWNSEK